MKNRKPDAAAAAPSAAAATVVRADAGATAAVNGLRRRMLATATASRRDHVCAVN